MEVISKDNYIGCEYCHSLIKYDKSDLIKDKYVEIDSSSMDIYIGTKFVESYPPSYIMQIYNAEDVICPTCGKEVIINKTLIETLNTIDEINEWTTKNKADLSQLKCEYREYKNIIP